MRGQSKALLARSIPNQHHQLKARKTMITDNNRIAGSTYLERETEIGNRIVQLLRSSPEEPSSTTTNLNIFNLNPLKLK